jgi:predicted PurR-regulated permease PerM
VLAFLIIKPFIAAILAAFVFSYIFYPVNNWINKKVKKNSISSLITLILILLIIVIPGSFLVKAIVQESYVAYLTTKQALSGDFEICETGAVCKLINKFERDVLGMDFKTYIKENVEKISSFVISKVSGFILGMANKILNIFIFIFLTFFLLRDGKYFGRRFSNILFIRAKNKKKAVNDISNLVYAVVFGTIIIAFIQGMLGALGFYLFGISSPIMWGFIMAFAALIPFVGSSIIWAPAGLFLIINGLFLPNPVLIWKGIGLFIYGAIIISSIDNVIRPKIIGDRSILHPTLVLLGVAGGIYMLGFIGIVVGPVILALLMIYLDMYESAV